MTQTTAGKLCRGLIILVLVLASVFGVGSMVLGLTLNAFTGKSAPEPEAAFPALSPMEESAPQMTEETAATEEATQDRSEFNMRTLSIIGDSYSTYSGWIPDGYAFWYADGRNEQPNNLTGVEQTWWHSLCTQEDLKLLINSSFSGSTVCHTGYDGADYANISFITRMERDFGPDCEEPGILLIFGGTNDHWAGVPLGQLQYSGWTEEELYTFAPAFCKMLDYFTTRFPNTKIYNLLNDFIVDDAMRQLIMEACEHYGVPVIAFTDIPKDNGHPNKAGMAAIRDQVAQRLRDDGVL